MDLLNFMGVECGDLEPIINIIKMVFKIIQFLIPLGLILMGSIDLGKAVISSDDKEIKQATGKLIKRAIAAAAVFLLVWLVNLVMNLVSEAVNGEGSGVDFMSCWNNTGSSNSEQ